MSRIVPFTKLASLASRPAASVVDHRRDLVQSIILRLASCNPSVQDAGTLELIDHLAEENIVPRSLPRSLRHLAAPIRMAIFGRRKTDSR
jgi:hypothetical protein